MASNTFPYTSPIFHDAEFYVSARAPDYGLYSLRLALCNHANIESSSLQETPRPLLPITHDRLLPRWLLPRRT